MFEILLFFCVQITLFHCRCHCHWVISNLFIDMYFITRHGRPTIIPITYPHNIVDIAISSHHLEESFPNNEHDLTPPPPPPPPYNPHFNPVYATDYTDQ